MKVFILAPAQGITGGPEALHQLCGALSERGADAEIVYVTRVAKWRVRVGHHGITDIRIRKEREFVHDPSATVPEPYRRYGVKVAGMFRPMAKDYVVVSEAKLTYLPLVGAATPIIWWLSVDNIGVGFGDMLQLRNGPALHLAQSKYAAEVARTLGFDVAGLLTDYISSDHSERASGGSGSRNGVAYNPSKGLAYLEKLRPHLTGLRLRPIENMTPAQVADLLRDVQIYLDVGDHPGRDRLPREAALAGAVVVSSSMGGAYHDEDMPLAEEFKFSKKKDALEAVASKLRMLISRSEEASAQQASYRQWISGQKNEFGRQVDALVKTIA